MGEEIVPHTGRDVWSSSVATCRQGIWQMIVAEIDGNIAMLGTGMSVYYVNTREMNCQTPTATAVLPPTHLVSHFATEEGSILGRDRAHHRVNRRRGIDHRKA